MVLSSMSSSFFIKNNKNPSKKRKFNNKQKQSKLPPQKPRPQDEEIDSDDAVNSAGEDDSDQGESSNAFDLSNYDEETPQDKRLRLAKKYLEEIEQEEKNRQEDLELHDLVSKRLKNEYLDSIGKLRKDLADSYRGYKEESIKYLKHKLQKHPTTCVVISNDGKFMFTGSKTQFVVKWDLENFKALGYLDCHNINEKHESDANKKRRSHILAMCLSSDMKFLAVAESGFNIQIWCPNELKLLKIFKGHRDVVTCLVFRKGTHQLFSGSKDRSVKLWSCDEMAYIESFFGHQCGVTGIDALHRERAITSGGMDCSVRIWKITEESQLIYNGHRGSIEDVKLINDENFISCGDDGSLCIWSTMKKKPLCVEPQAHGVQENGEANYISAIAALVNTNLIASGSCDGFIRIWKMSDHGKKLTEMFKIPVKGFINSLAFTPDGTKLIAAVSQEHKLGRWERIKEVKNQFIVIEFDKVVDVS